MEKAGDVVIGRNNYFGKYDPVQQSDIDRQRIPRGRADQCLIANGPVTLVYGEPKEGFNIPLFGAYCKSPTLDLPRPFLLQKPIPESFDGHGYYSRAPLRRVTRCTVYHNPSSGYSRGILFEYEHGGCRTVGQCRVNVDPCETVAEPSVICIRNDPYTDTASVSRAKVKFIQNLQQDELDEGWKRHPMTGFIEFYFYDEWVYVEMATYFSEDVELPLEW